MDEAYWDEYCKPFFEFGEVHPLDIQLFKGIVFSHAEEKRIREDEEKADAYYRSLEP